MNNPVDPVYELVIVIVLYHTELADSKSYQSVSKAFKTYAADHRPIDLIVVNNGPLSITINEDDPLFRFHFKELLDNPGVSKAYNIAAALAGDLQKRWLLILDQDTHLPPDFWNQYCQSIRGYPNMPVYAPRLYADNILISPCGYRYYRGYLLTDLAAGTHPMQGRNVLNSGLLIDVNAFRRVEGYDEKVRLYFSDFVFFDRLKEQYTTFAVVDVNLQHELSSTDYSAQSTAVQRFSLYCEGARAASKHEVIRSFLYFITVGGRSLVMNHRFKSWLFSRIFLHNWFAQDR